MMLELQIGLLGGGVMAEAIVRGILTADLISSDKIWVSDVSPERLKVFEEMGVNGTMSNAEVVAKCDIVIVAVKPDKVCIVLTECRTVATKGKLFVSIAAGVQLGTLQKCLPVHSHVVRVMLNSPCIVGASATAYSLGNAATEEDKVTVNYIFSALGEIAEVPESMMNAVTGLSGSGPGFVFMFIEALEDAGVLVGLPRHVSRTLAAQTVFGSAKMALQDVNSHKHTDQWHMSETPGGTAIAGIHALEKRGFRGIVMDAVVTATERCEELGSLSSASK